MQKIKGARMIAALALIISALRGISLAQDINETVPAAPSPLQKPAVPRADGAATLPPVSAQTKPAHRPSRLGSRPAGIEAPPSDYCANTDVLGTSRTIQLGTAGGLEIGLKTYPQTLKLADKEVVLTFDDGPLPGNTDKVLDALKAECVKATFFLIGRNALTHQALVSREIAEGHSLGNHSWSHPSVTLRGLSEAAAIDEVQKGFAAIAEASGNTQRSLKFFRFPGFADSAPLRKYLASNDVAIFGTDVWASDWRTMAPDMQLQLLMERLRTERRGIILLHDTRGQTAAMVPGFLRRLKAEGFKIVHLVQGSERPPELARAPEGWSPETEAILTRVMPRLTGTPNRRAGPVMVAPVPRKPVNGPSTIGFPTDLLE